MLRRLPLLLVLALALAACGGDGDAAPQPADDADDTPASGAAGVEVTGELGAKPTVTIPDGAPPAELVVHDIVVGDGAEAGEGATVTTHYVGIGWDSKTEFDASWNGGQPLQFPLSGVIAGWTQGIPGMKVGGRRLLVIPGELAYGPNPPGAGIGPNETLVFVIDLVSTP